MGITEKSAEVPPGDAYTVGHDTRRDKRRGVIVKVYPGDGPVNEA